MKSILFLLTLLVSSAAFAPQMFGVRESNTILFAKHVQDKAARWAKAKRPRKSRASDINRKPIIYEVHTMTKPAEFSISDAPASPLPKPEKFDSIDFSDYSSQRSSSDESVS